MYSKRYNQNSMHYSSSSNPSDFNKNTQILPNNLSKSFKNSSESLNNPNFMVVDQGFSNQIGPSFFQQSSR